MDFFLKARFLIPVSVWLIIAVLLYSYLKFLKKKELTSDYLQRQDLVIVKWYYKFLPHPRYILLLPSFFALMFIAAFVESSAYEEACHAMFKIIAAYRIGYVGEISFTDMNGFHIVWWAPYVYVFSLFLFLEKFLYEFIFMIAPKFSDYKFNKDLSKPKEISGFKRNLAPLFVASIIVVAFVLAPEFWVLILVVCVVTAYFLRQRSKENLAKDKLIWHRVWAIRNLFKWWCILLVCFLTSFYVPIYSVSEKGLEITQLVKTESISWSELKSLELNFEESRFGLEDGEEPKISNISSSITINTANLKMNLWLFDHTDSEKQLINFLKEKGVPVICNVSPLARELLVKELSKELLGRDRYSTEAIVSRLTFCN